MQKEPKLRDQVRAAVRFRHYFIRTETAYVSRIRRFILFHDKRHPRDMGKREISVFLTHPAVKCNISASTQNQVLNALLFLYRDELNLEFEWLDNVVRAKRTQRLPTVMNSQETHRVLAHLQSQYRLMAYLLYDSGLRLMECLRLRVKDIQFNPP